MHCNVMDIYDDLELGDLVITKTRAITMHYDRWVQFSRAFLQKPIFIREVLLGKKEQAGLLLSRYCLTYNNTLWIIQQYLLHEDAREVS